METTISEAAIKAIKFSGYKIELSTNIKGKPVARLYKFITVGINKNTYKLIEGFYFNDEIKREAWIKEKITNINANVKSDQDRKAAKKNVRANMTNPFKVGEIYYDSWGYEQTNIDFYEIIEVKEKSVILQEIGAKYCDSEGYSSMAAMIAPDNSIKIGEPFLKPITFYLDRDNKPVYHLKSKHGWISLYTKSDKGVYCSWYA